MTSMPPALRDKMLRLMGGCMHTWHPAADAHTYECECGLTWQSADLARQPLPAVGDGHEPTTDELLTLCRQRELGFVVVRWYGNECWVDVGYEPFSHEYKGRGVEDAPRIALATAIAEAVKGERG